MNICLDQAKDSSGAFHFEVHAVPEGFQVHCPTHPHIPAVTATTESDAIVAMNNRMSTFLASNFQIVDG